MKPSWQQVALYLGALLIVGILALKGVDTTAIIGLIVALLLGGTLGVVQQVKDQSNGNHTQMVDLIREQSRQLARSAPIVAPEDASPQATEGNADAVRSQG